MSAEIILLAEYRKRPERDPMSLLFGGLEFYGICQIAILFGGIAALRIIHERLYGR